MQLKDIIARAKDVKSQAVEVPEWNTTVYLKELNLGERLELFDVITSEANKDKLLYVFAIIYSVCDQDGARVFALEDYDLVTTKAYDVVLRLGKLCAAFNKLVDDVVEQKKHLKKHPERATFYQLCVELKRLPDELRTMSTDDYISLIATMSKGAAKVLPWNQGGKGVLLGWVEAMKKRNRQ